MNYGADFETPSQAQILPEDRDPLFSLLVALRELGYHFSTVTPSTHARVVSRKEAAEDLRDILGWSLGFEETVIPRNILRLLEQAGAIEKSGHLLKSRMRVSNCGDNLFLHSAYPTTEAESVFFGPDSYRFVKFIAEEMGSGAEARHIVDLGCGTGVGGIEAGALVPHGSVTLIDSNPKALRYAAANSRAAGIDATLLEMNGLPASFPQAPDLIIANPPYMLDPDGPSYRDGGRLLGAEVSLQWARAAAERLSPGGRMLLYTGAAIVAGGDALKEALKREAPALGCSLSYREIDVDVFGDELDRPAYAQVERIAAVGAVLRRHA